MNLKERIQDIFNAYSVNLEVEEKDKEAEMEDKVKEEEVAMAEKTLANGTIIYTDAEAFAVGVDVFIVNDEGERMPLPDGEYEYEEGGKTVVADGKIAEMIEAEEEEEEKEMEHTPDHKEEEMSEEVTFTQDQVTSMIKEAVAKAITDLEKEASAKDLELKAMKQKLSSERADLGLRQSANTNKRMTFSDLKGLSAKDRVAKIHEFYSNL